MDINILPDGYGIYTAKPGQSSLLHVRVALEGPEHGLPPLAAC